MVALVFVLVLRIFLLDVGCAATCSNFDLTVDDADLRILLLSPSSCRLIRWVPLDEFVLEFNGLLHRLYDKRDVQRGGVLGKDLIQMDLGHATELGGLELLHLP